MKQKLDFNQMLQLYSLFGPESELASAMTREQGRGLRLQNLFQEQTLQDRVREQALRNEMLSSQRVGLDTDIEAKRDAMGFDRDTRNTRMLMLQEELKRGQLGNSAAEAQLNTYRKYGETEALAGIQGRQAQTAAQYAGINNLARELAMGERELSGREEERKQKNMLQVLGLEADPGQKAQFAQLMGLPDLAKGIAPDAVDPAAVEAMGALGVPLDPRSGRFDYSLLFGKDGARPSDAIWQSSDYDPKPLLHLLDNFPQYADKLPPAAVRRYELERRQQARGPQGYPANTFNQWIK